MFQENMKADQLEKEKEAFGAEQEKQKQMQEEKQKFAQEEAERLKVQTTGKHIDFIQVKCWVPIT